MAEQHQRDPRHVGELGRAVMEAAQRGVYWLDFRELSAARRPSAASFREGLSRRALRNLSMASGARPEFNSICPHRLHTHASAGLIATSSAYCLSASSKWRSLAAANAQPA